MFNLSLYQSRLKPGRMLLVDTKEKTIIQDVELKMNISTARPYTNWLKEQVTYFVFLVVFINFIQQRPSREREKGGNPPHWYPKFSRDPKPQNFQKIQNSRIFQSFFTECK